MIYHFEVFNSVILTVEILRGVIEDMEVIHVLQGVYLLMKLVVEFDVFIETSTGRSCSWVGRRLPLPLHGLHHFSCFWVNAPERVHLAIFRVMNDRVACFADNVRSSRYTPASRGASRRPHHVLASRRMVHVLRLIIS